MTRLKTYAHYKESGIEWVGRIPADWETRPLFAVVRENVASNRAGAEDNLLSLSYGRIVRKDIGGTDGLLPASFDTYQIINRNDLVLRLTDLQNDKRSLRSAISPERGIITSAYLAVTPTHIRPGFLSYLLRAYDLQKVFYAMGGGLRQSMKFSDMKWLPVVLPPEPLQEKITEYLDQETAQIDDLIVKQQQLIELLSEERQALITHAVTRGLDPAVSTKPTGIPWFGDIPAHWTASRLKFAVRRIQQGVSPQADGVPASSGSWGVLKSGCVNGGVFKENENKQLPGDFVIDPAIVVKVGDLLVSRACGSPKLVGSAARVRSLDSNLILSDKTFRFTLEPDMDDDFLEWFLNSHPYREQVEGSISGADGLANNISTTALKNIQLPRPPKTEQARIARELRLKTDVLARLDSAARKTINLLHERRGALISAAVTGKVVVGL
ncbi:restriction endonuclease subunit S [[Micrococcus luteus] ATCC 49442]|uniref:restriction endonuclease subunit S n=1 Tax=[Micrococcus luteus] ATCC 49442 TaxID=2698727 RepID=UPI0013DCFE1C|nr:restriction endonuclease subunit S [[Micrococcus luteus] ATCC 49442]